MENNEMKNLNFYARREVIMGLEISDPWDLTVVDKIREFKSLF